MPDDTLIIKRRTPRGKNRAPVYGEIYYSSHIGGIFVVKVLDDNIVPHQFMTL